MMAAENNAVQSSAFVHGKLNITQLIEFLNNILMDNVKWQYLVGECKMDFPIATLNNNPGIRWKMLKLS